MKMLTGLVGLAIMAVATPAAAYTNPPEGDPGGTRGEPTEVPAPPVALLFGLAAGAIMLRRKIA